MGKWPPIGDMNQLRERLQQMQGALQTWDSNAFGSVKKRLAKLRDELEKVRGRSIGIGLSRDERRFLSQISELLSREEIMEKQRSRMDWLQAGDRNTSFFQDKYESDCSASSDGWLTVD